MAEARCPASCGEFIQGWIGGSEKLISCPIDWFSTVSVTQGNAASSRQRPRMRQALELALQSLDIPASESDGLKIEFDSTIPVAKGMASSTADIAATIAATYRHYRQAISESELAALCVQIEPSDSTMFSRFTLFDHHRGAVTEQFDTVNNLDVLVLESTHQLCTASYHRIARQNQLQRSGAQLQHSVVQFAQALHSQDLYQLGHAATTSAIESQHIVMKPHFNQLLQLVEKHGLYGINLAHSGTVAGLLFDRTKHDIKAVTADINATQISQTYTCNYLCQVIAGGIGG
ncbi:GHMP kinase [Vibrio sp. ABG19]|uniref:GHMP family kinase ATP-binding protein n=1 Tax=Vibrio sp. ABG19 TaxID=2817385 RepID=UPI00249F2C1F|nr:GHMP kinase [Vibrio sp. ABG19]WGY44951.1 GHMP kinase [Vibrio sp. ABG19]